MNNIPLEFKKRVVEATFKQRENFSCPDGRFAQQIGLNAAVYSRMKNGEIDKIASDSWWLKQGRELNVSIAGKPLKVAETAVYKEIRDNLNFCKQYSKSMILVDDCGIGKTFCAKHILKSIPNSFYVDCSQAKTKMTFVRALAKKVGLGSNGKYVDIKANLIDYLNLLPSPLVVIDEAGDLDYTAFLDLKELWNGTENQCGWYMMGAEGLRNKINLGIKRNKVGYREIFSRFSDEYISLVPVNMQQKQD